MHPCIVIVLYKATGNPQEICNKPIGVAGFCIASFVKLQSGNNVLMKIPEKNGSKHVSVSRLSSRARFNSIDPAFLVS